MRLLLDQGVPRTATALFRAASHDAVHVNARGHADADDETILALARADGRAIVTMDADVHQLLAATGVTAPSVVRVGVEGLKAQQLVDLRLPVLGRLASAIELGAAVSVTDRSVRTPTLPIGSTRVP